MELIYQFLPFCFFRNRLKYARDLSYNYLDMIDLATRNPEAYNYLKSGGFVVSLSGTTHSCIPMDQVIETTINRFSKEFGGLCGVTENVGANEKWIRLNPYLCALKQHLNITIGKKRKNNHVEWGKKRMGKDEDDVQTIMQGLSD